jgi:endonuclease-3
MHELISTMLSHRTSQANEAKAFDRMWERFGSWEGIMKAPLPELEEAISPVQFPGPKAYRIREVLGIIKKERGSFSIDFLKKLSAEEGMTWLMALPGVGLKTASLVLLFCFRKAVLPVDTHVHRISQRVGLIGPKVNADKAHQILQDMLPADYKVLFNFHHHLLWHGQQVCKWAAPKHKQCPLRGFCRFYKEEQQQKKMAARLSA